MIINLKKHLFIGSKDAVSDFFIRAQEVGFIEFITDQLTDLANLDRPTPGG